MRSSSLIIRLLLVIVFVPTVWAETKQVKVGFIAALTGNRSSNGDDARRGAELAIEDLGEKLSKDFSIIYEDSQADPKTAISAFQKLSSEGIKVFITQNSNVSIPILELSQRSRALQLAISTTSDKYSTEGDLAIRVNGPTNYEAKTMADFIAARPGAVSILTMQDEYPVILNSNLISELSSRNITPVVNQEFNPQERDFRSLLSKTRNSNIVVCLGYQAQCGMLVRQLRELKSSAVVIANTPVNSKEFFNAAGDYAEGVYVTCPIPDYQHPAAINFQNKYGYLVNFFAASAYDAVMLLGKSLPDCKDQAELPACLARQILSNDGYNGLSGKKSVNKLNGDMSDNYAVLVSKSGLFVPID